MNADGYVSTGQGILSANMFAYCGNNPVAFVDPRGMCPHNGIVIEQYNSDCGLCNPTFPTTNLTFSMIATTPFNSTTFLSNILYSNQKPGKTPPSKWPNLPDNLGGKKPKWNPEGYWEGKEGRITWDDHSHGSGIDRGNGGHRMDIGIVKIAINVGIGMGTR